MGSQIFQEIGKLYGVEKEIEKLRGTVTRIEAILKDAKEKQPHNHQVENWLKRLRGVVKEAKDFLPPQQNAEGEFTEESREKPPEQNAGGTITGESREKTPEQNVEGKITEESREKAPLQKAGGKNQKRGLQFLFKFKPNCLLHPKKKKPNCFSFWYE